MISSGELPETTRGEVGRILNLLIADEYILCATARGLQRNLEHPDALEHRRECEPQSGFAAERIAQIAERAREIGVGARRKWEELVKMDHWLAHPASRLPAERVVFELLTLHEEIIGQLRIDSEACAHRFKDVATAEFLKDLMGQHEKATWVLRAQLETEEEDTG